MTGVLSNVEVSFYGRNPYIKGKILIELTEWVESNGVYIATVLDYFAEIVTHDGQDYLKKTLIPKLSPDKIEISAEKYNALAAYAETLFTTGMTPVQKQEMRKAVALLQYIRTDFIDPDNTKTVYDLLPGQWSIYNG